ncbi:ABC transporter permease [Rhizobiales bacterium 3FA27D7]|jgi:simple sugar transport system permease protein|uniref:ABC transporter permease n=1 Tax=Mesorhizobium sp. 2RAF21 TaxID=3232995 RepID=UPI0010F837C5
MLDDFIISSFLVTWLAASVRLAVPLLLTALGEIFAERSGVLNVGIEGTILLGALAAYLVTFHSGSPWLGFVVAILVGIFVNLFLAWMYVTVLANQVVVGIVFNILALGVASYGYQLAAGSAASPELVPMFEGLHIPILSDIPFFGPVLFSHSILLYVTIFAVLAAEFALFRTTFGLNIRAVGENPIAAANAGISVPFMRYVGVLLSGAGAGAAGAYLVLAQVGLFRDTIVVGQGFIALAIVIFGRWRPIYAAIAAIAFGAADALQLSLQLFAFDLPPQLLLSLPYVLTIIAVSGLIGRVAQPAALMEPYRRS